MHSTSLACLCCCPAPGVRLLKLVPAALQTDVVPVGNDQVSAADCHAVAAPSVRAGGGSHSLSRCLEHAACSGAHPMHPSSGKQVPGPAFIDCAGVSAGHHGSTGCWTAHCSACCCRCSTSKLPATSQSA